MRRDCMRRMEDKGGEGIEEKGSRRRDEGSRRRDRGEGIEEKGSRRRDQGEGIEEKGGEWRERGEGARSTPFISTVLQKDNLVLSKTDLQFIQFGVLIMFDIFKLSV